MAALLCLLSRAKAHPLAFVFILFVVFTPRRITAARECYSCDSAKLDCDPDLNICTSDCNTKSQCNSKSDFCLFAMMKGNDTERNVIEAQLGCFPNDMSEPIMAVTDDYCAVIDNEVSYTYSSPILSDLHTCICSGDSCNDAIYLHGSIYSSMMTTTLLTKESNDTPLKPDGMTTTTSPTKELNDTPHKHEVVFTPERATAVKECYTCDSAKLDCDPDLNICTSDCTTKSQCSSKSDFCLLVMKKGNGTNVFEANLSCFLNEISGPTIEVTGDYCGIIDEELDYTYSSSYLSDLHTCMCSGDSCNGAIYLNGSDISLIHKDQEDDRERADTTGKQIAIIVLAVASSALVICIVVFVIGYVYMKRRRNKTCFGAKDHIPSSNTESTSLDLTTDSDMKIIDEDDPPETPIHMSGNYLPLTLDTVIGRGRFGAVWKAQHKHGDGKTFLAVKVFQEFDSASWNVEKELFTDESVTLHHDNVIEYIAAEVRRAGYQQNKQFWLVTRYYPKGSLQDYLSARTVTWPELCRMSQSTARGVAHLHADVYGSHGLHKIPVAHRDLKSSNILVKEDGECVVADFGLAIKLDPRVSTDTLANSGQVGTARYMSPEALESKVNLQDIESFKQMDVYSLALIIWEITNRCTLNKDTHEYYLPFDDLITGYPSVEAMKTVVVQRGLRPTIPDSWQQSTGMKLVANTITECWDADPEARLTASCVEARFSDMITWVEGEQHLGHNDSHSVTLV